MTPGQQKIRHETRAAIGGGDVKLSTWAEASRAGHTNLGAWMRLVGYDARKTVMTLRPYILHPEGVDLHGDWRLAAHELVHWRRQPTSRAKLWCWIVKYGLSQKFRAVEELHAHLVDLESGRWRDIDDGIAETRKFHRLSGIDPLWMRDWLDKRRANSAA